MKSIFHTANSDETESLGESFVSRLRGQKIFFFGDLGVGKTTFLRGLARGFKIKSKIKSPTFVGEHEHSISKNEKLIHLDLFRSEIFEVEKIERLRELFESSATVVVEWSERLPRKFLPRKRIELRFRELKSGVRKITFAKFSENFRSKFFPNRVADPNSPARFF